MKALSTLHVRRGAHMKALSALRVRRGARMKAPSALRVRRGARMKALSALHVLRGGHPHTPTDHQRPGSLDEWTNHPERTGLQTQVRSIP